MNIKIFQIQKISKYNLHQTFEELWRNKKNCDEKENFKIQNNNKYNLHQNIWKTTMNKKEYKMIMLYTRLKITY